MTDQEWIESPYYASLERYRTHGTPPGHCLRAALENNLQQFVARADHDALAAVKRIATYINCKLPMSAWGSNERVHLWINAGGLPKKEEPVDA